MMKIISKIENGIARRTAPSLNKIAEHHWIAKQLEKGLNDPARYAAAMLVMSIVSKDLVGCLLYTTQSYNNKKIPEEKRKFVAAVDLMNGIIMVGGQFLIGKIIEAKETPKLLGKRFTGTIKDKFTGKETSIPNAKGPLASDNIVELAQKIMKENKDEIKKLHLDINDTEAVKAICEKMVKRYGNESKQYKAIATGFGILVTAIATTALTKRTLAPLLSTPLAGWFKEHVMERKKEVFKDRAYYQWATLTPKNKLDRTPFSNFNTNTYFSNFNTNK